MMKYFLFFISFYLYSFTSKIQAQEFTYFQNTLFNDTSAFLTPIAKPIANDESFSVGLHFDGITISLYATRLDKYGNVKWIKIIDNENVAASEIGRQALQLQDGNILVTYSKFKSNPDYLDIGLVKLNLEGEILWKKIIADSTSKKAHQVIELENGDLMLGGYQYIIDETVGFYILKTDALGNMIWERRHEFGTNSRGATIQPTTDGHFIMGGFSYHPASKSDMQVVKIDTLGNLIWEKKYGGMDGDCGAHIVPLTTVEEYESGKEMEYLLSGCWEKHDRDKMYLAKLDENGEIIWERFNDPFANATFKSLIRNLQTFPLIKKNKGIIGATYYNRPAGIFNIIVPLIIDFDTEGNINWMKELKPDTLAFGQTSVQMYIRDMQPTPDGGYLIAGFQSTPLPQKSWVAKIDSLGNTCFPANCDSTIILTDIPEFEENNIHFSISPNPVYEQATIHYQLPLGKEGVLEVYDIQGKRMMRGALVANEREYSELTLEVSDWSSGVYFYRLEVEGERVGGGKLVVE